MKRAVWSAVACIVAFVDVPIVYSPAGGSVTGEPGMVSRGAAASPVDPDEARLQAELASNPEDAEGRLALAQLYVARQNWMGVWNETSKVLERSPGSPRALAACPGSSAAHRGTARLRR